MHRSRREFLELAGMTGGALLIPSVARLADSTPLAADLPPALNPNLLERFVDPLPIAPVARSSGMRPSPRDPAVKLPVYRLEMRAIDVKLHRDLPPTRQWSYGGSVPGPTIETRSGEGLLVEWVNNLPTRHFLPIDHTIHGAEASKPEVRTVAHVHGACVPPESDGYPENWQVPGQSRTFHYPNSQQAATLWYHDHAMGITRLNLFAGLLGTFIVTDAEEEALNLPRGEFDIPLMLYDRTLDRSAQLLYPRSNKPAAPWVSEFYGNMTLCNGKFRPYLEVQPRRYRFRILNGANSRFFGLRLSNGKPFQQIGTDMGLLPGPLEQSMLLLYPAERAEVVLDFAGHEGERIVLRNQHDDLLQFRVASVATGDSSTLPATLRPVPRIPESQATTTRMLTLAEHDNPAGNSMMMTLYGSHWDDPITESPVLDSTEIWSFLNATTDAHPIHLHLVRFQILDRRPFDIFAYNANKSVVYTGPAQPPAPGEAGWKDTVRVDPHMVTRIIIRFAGYAGRYVWHCHLLEHEDNEMMRPYEVVASAAGSTIDPTATRS
jgi:spore coat protein A